jgi:hypothetical protein
MGEDGQNGSRPGAGVIDAERLELAAVLASPTFSRAQRLVKLLEYISERHFAGQDSQVCEYSIATEVLGRPADFDPGEDAIARVEIHRLRKKLREYYAAEGARETLKIIIPPGMYTPVFQQDGNTTAALPANGKTVTEPVVEPEPVAEALSEPALAVPADLAEVPPSTPYPVPQTQPNRKRRKIWFLAAAATILIVATAAVTLATLRTAPPRVAEPPLPRPSAGLIAAPADNAVRIIAGYDRKYIDHYGHTWLPDRYFEGGGRPATGSFRPFIARTADPLIYQNGRLGMAAYNIPLKPGDYELKLHFVEQVYGPGLATGGGENSRVFDIRINGRLLVYGFDIVSDAGGPLIADTRVFKDVQPGPDGILRIGFHAEREQPIISAIEVEPAEPHRLNPIRIVTQANSVTDSHGQVWEADNYFVGGQASNHWKAVTGTPDGDLFANERYGHFTYAIPVAPGSYTVSMYFAEIYWGEGNEGGGSSGQRVFDVFGNGSALLRNFDMLKEAGPNLAIVKRFHGMRPNAQGKLNLDFVPVVNYASVFAIEVLDEGR